MLADDFGRLAARIDRDRRDADPRRCPEYLQSKVMQLSVRQGRAFELALCVLERCGKCPLPREKLSAFLLKQVARLSYVQSDKEMHIARGWTKRSRLIYR